MPSASEYFSFLSKELQARSELMKDWFATHHLSAGMNREDLLIKLLETCAGNNFTISSGLALSCAGEFSKQADVFIVDGNSNKAFFGTSTVPIWLIESVYALFEVKTSLSPADIKDGLGKCKRFKKLPRNFNAINNQPIDDSLFILWGFNAPSEDTFKKNILAALSELEDDELPDFIVVPGKYLVVSGSYNVLKKFGQKNSHKRKEFLASNGEAAIDKRSYEFNVLDDHTLLVFINYLLSWLTAAGPRTGLIASYLDMSASYGTFDAGSIPKLLP